MHGEEVDQGTKLPSTTANDCCLISARINTRRHLVVANNTVHSGINQRTILVLTNSQVRVLNVCDVFIIGPLSLMSRIKR